jgi:hypothetical protein
VGKSWTNIVLCLVEFNIRIHHLSCRSSICTISSSSHRLQTRLHCRIVRSVSRSDESGLQDRVQRETRHSNCDRDVLA